MLAVAELVARGLVDRDRYGVCRRVAPVPRMEHECFRVQALGRHSILRGRAPVRHFAMSAAWRVSRFRGAEKRKFGADATLLRGVDAVHPSSRGMIGV